MPRKTNKQITRERTEYLKRLQKNYTDATKLYVELIEHKYSEFVTGPEDISEAVEKYYDIKSDYERVLQVYPLSDIKQLRELIEGIRNEINNMLDDL